MKSANENGVYEAEERKEVARYGRAYAAISLCQCDDGLFRASCGLSYSYGGFGGPIFHSDAGHATRQAAEDAAIAELLERIHTPWPGDPAHVKAELDAIRAQLEERLSQLSLF